MDEEIQTLLIPVRADVKGFGRDVTVLTGQLKDGLGQGAERASDAIEQALLRAVRSGKLGFDDLKSFALKALDEVAAASLRTGIDSISSGQGLGGLAASLIGAITGKPGRATGGPVSPGAAYLVGERGPELFVPTSSGRVAALPTAQNGRDVRVSIAINAPTGGEPQALARSSRQVARAVARALDAAEG